MKKLILLAGLLIYFVACKNEKKLDPNMDDDDTTEMVEETEIDQEANSTDLDFEAAIAAFRQKDYATAAKYIASAEIDVKKETTATDAKSKKQLEETLATLQSLADRVKSGKVISEVELEEIFAYVDMMTSHHYLVLTEVYALDAPDKAKNSYQKAAEKMDNAAKKLDGKAKEDCSSIASAIKADLGKGEQINDHIGEVAGEKVHRLHNWLAAKAAKFGIKAPEQDPDE
ncbi:MAG: hypothetical protein R2825_09195 [Saprospiraceae bacterium]